MRRGSHLAVSSFFFFTTSKKKGVGKGSGWIIKRRAAPANCTSKTPWREGWLALVCKKLARAQGARDTGLCGGIHCWGCRRPTGRAPHARAHTLMCTCPHVHIYTHTLSMLMRKQYYPPGLHLGGALRAQSTQRLPTG